MILLVHFPLSALAALLLSNTIDNPMPLFVFQVFSDPVSLVLLPILQSISLITFFTINPQSVLLGVVSAELAHTLALPLHAFRTKLLPDTFNLPMCFLVLVVSLSHFL